MGGWCPKTTSDRTDYLQVDMGKLYSVCGVATQGKRVEWSTSYKLRLSTDGVNWNPYKKDNTEKVTKCGVEEMVNGQRGTIELWTHAGGC